MARASACRKLLRTTQMGKDLWEFISPSSQAFNKTFITPGF
jgi:hypothetical protein